MRINPRLAGIELVGGHPALDFVNTVHNWNADPPPDYFENFDDVVDWHGLRGLLGDAEVERFRAAPGEQKQQAFRDALELRAGLHRIFAALAQGARPPAPALEHLGQVLEHTMRWRRLVADGEGRAVRFRWDFGEAPPGALLGPVAWQAVDLLENGPLERVKECPGERCAWLFLDSSKNRSRTWCSMKACGNMAKVRRFRQRAGA